MLSQLLHMNKFVECLEFFVAEGVFHLKPPVPYSVWSSLRPGNFIEVEQDLIMVDCLSVSVGHPAYQSA